ncbi:MAG: hypothetical protein AAF996_08785 [Pseudomonadota bacterium]
MIDEGSSLGSWQQGDFALEVGGFIFAARPDEDDLLEDANQKLAVRETEDQIVGAVIVSQTCDIVQMRGTLDVVQICPLVFRSQAAQKEIAKGRRPSLAIIENSPPGTYADLSRIMSVTKDLLVSWQRHSGFDDARSRLKFAAALERKFGRFAFPDDFNASMVDFQKRVWSKHDKKSDLGAIYRSIRQIRFRSAPDWTAERKEIAMIAILEEPNEMTVDRDTIRQELVAQIDKIELSDGYRWGHPKFVLLSLSELSAQELLESQPADFDFLSQ